MICKICKRRYGDRGINYWSCESGSCSQCKEGKQITCIEEY